jgi:hypothetical protein
MAKYSKKAAAKVARAMKKRKAGTLRSGGSGKKVTSKKQAIAIGLSEARAEGKKVPKAPKKDGEESQQEDGGEKESGQKNPGSRRRPEAAPMYVDRRI